MKEIKTRSSCPVSYTLDFLGDKWTLLIIRDIVIHEKSTYGEFLSSSEKIATNILADRLALLEQYGFLTRKVASDKKNKFIYSLTSKGISLIPIVIEMMIWGSEFNPLGIGHERLEALKTNKEGEIQKIQLRLSKASEQD